MRRLVLLCLAAVAATSAYNLVIENIKLQGGLITSKTVTCDNIKYLNIEAKPFDFHCYNIPADGDSIEACNLAYMGDPIVTQKTKLDAEILLTDGEKVSFTFAPQLNKVGQKQDLKPDGKWTPLAASVSSTTVTAPTTPPPVCKNKTSDTPCICSDQVDIKENPDDCTCPDSNPTCKPPVAPPGETKKAEKKTIPRPQLLEVKAENATGAAAAAATAAATVAADAPLPAAVRLRGPGPVRPPVHRRPVEITVVDEEDEERLRVKRDDQPKVDESINVSVMCYVLDEAGNPAAVWTAVIEGIILILLVGLCFYYFFWAPRARSVASAAADPYKEGPNYSVSYANSSFNQSNQRIDAFQNPPAPAPAAPSRPANSSYMDDYVTDNIGAMSRSAAAPAVPVASAASAANPVVSDFRPGHQRFDSSGLVTVNLS